MTAPISQQTVAVKDTAAARKRRRRAPAGGASDDCFTCTKRNVKCDRRRPYCSQCLEVSNECSGYKTQLTWGVGVASRGKLRGLSLPIAKAPPVSREPKKATSARSRSSTATSIAGSSHGHSHSHNHNHNHTHSNTSAGPLHWNDHDDGRRGVGMPTRGPIDIPSVSHVQAAASAPTTPYGMPGYDYLAMSHPENTPPMAQGSWGSMGYSPSMVHSPDVHPRYSKFPLSLVTEGLSSSVSSVNSDVDYMSPISQSYTREELPFVNSPPLLYDNYSTHQNSPVPQSPPSSIAIDHSRAPTSCPGLVYTPSEAGSMHHSHHLDVFESQIGHKLMRECDTLSEHHSAPCLAYPF